MAKKGKKDESSKHIKKTSRVGRVRSFTSELQSSLRFFSFFHLQFPPHPKKPQGKNLLIPHHCLIAVIPCVLAGNLLCSTDAGNCTNASRTEGRYPLWKYSEHVEHKCQQHLLRTVATRDARVQSREEGERE